MEVEMNTGQYGLCLIRTIIRNIRINKLNFTTTRPFRRLLESPSSRMTSLLTRSIFGKLLYPRNCPQRSLKQRPILDKFREYLSQVNHHDKPNAQQARVNTAAKSN